MLLALMWTQYLAPPLLSLLPLAAPWRWPAELSWGHRAPAPGASGVAGAAAFLVPVAASAHRGRPGHSAAEAAVRLVWRP